MKKLVLLFFAVASSVIYTGCEKDETEPLNQPDPIIGKWEFNAKLIKKGENSDNNTAAYTVLTTEASTYPLLVDCGSITFEESGNFSYSSSELGSDQCTALTGTFNREYSNKYVLNGSKVLYTNFAYGLQQLFVFEEVKFDIEPNNPNTKAEIYTIKTVYTRG